MNHRQQREFQAMMDEAERQAFQATVQDATFYNIHKILEPRLKDLVKALYEQLKISNKGYLKERKIRALESILANLYQIGVLQNKGVIFFRYPNPYYILDKKQYGKDFYSYNIMVPIIDELERLGYVWIAKGGYNQDSKSGRASRMWPTQKLDALFSSYQVNPGSIRHEPLADVIHLNRGEKKKKKLVGYKDKRKVKATRGKVIRYNKLVKSSEILLDIPLGAKLSETSVGQLWRGIMANRLTPITPDPSIWYRYMTNWHGRIRPMDPIRGLGHVLREASRGRSSVPSFSFPPFITHKILCKVNVEEVHRVFNESPKFNLGGRHYGATHQGLSEELRQYLTINGEKTAEIDFQGFHPRLLYHWKAKTDYRGDPYAPGGNTKIREACKIAYMIWAEHGLTTGTYPRNKKELEKVFRGTLRSIKYHLKNEAIQLPPGMKAINIMSAFYKEHEPIIRFLHKRGNHLEMQNKDSQIMERILKSMGKAGVLVLPIHDSVVTPKKKVDLTKQIMIESYQQVLKTQFKPVLKVSGLD